MFGKRAIVDCYENEEFERFAFFKGKELVVSGSSSEELEKYCDRLAMTGSAATYKFRLYDSDTQGKITHSTEYECNYEVKFNDPYQGNGVVGGWGNEFLGRIEKLEKKINGDGEGKDDRLTEAVMGWLEDPQQLVQVVGAFRSLIGQGSPQPMGAISGVEQPKIITPDQEAKTIKLCEALDTIEKHDPNIVQHMQKLASIAQTNPAMFSTLLGMLEKF